MLGLKVGKKGMGTRHCRQPIAIVADAVRNLF